MGCPKNVVEGELVAGIVRDAGWGMTTEIAKASDVLVHTCAFIRDARKESESVIAGCLSRKDHGLVDRVFVSGCLVQDDIKALKDRFPGVDGYLGTGRLREIGRLLEKGSGTCCGRPGGLMASRSPRLLSTDLPSAYLRIAEGCDHRCSFCSIPRLRGGYRSRPAAAIVREAEELVGRGVRELVVIAQDTSSYGRDLYGVASLGKLLRRIAAIKDARWIRLMYAYPTTVGPDVIDLLAHEPKLCSYLDIPLQHVADSVLARMQRPRKAAELVRSLMERVPGISLRTSFIVGFPGETEREFRALRDFVAQGFFDHAGVFEYSANPGVPSSRYGRQIPETLKRERYRELMLAQKKVVAGRQRARIGKIYEVLTEHHVALNGKQHTRNTWAGRAAFQAPEVDGTVVFRGHAKRGAFSKVSITGYRGYDLTGTIVE